MNIYQIVDSTGQVVAKYSEKGVRMKESDETDKSMQELKKTLDNWHEVKQPEVKQITNNLEHIEL